MVTVESVIHLTRTYLWHSLEALTSSGTYDRAGSFEDDLNRLQDILEDGVPAYVLARLDTEASEWLAIHYVPETAKVREKVRTHSIPLISSLKRNIVIFPRCYTLPHAIR